MDLEDEGWVSVPYDGLLEVHDDGDEKFFSRKYVKSPTKFYKQNYFNTSHTSQYYVDDEPVFVNQFDHKEMVEEIIKLPILITEPKETSFESEPELKQDPIFQVFFKKENQFVDMTMGSPRLSYHEYNLSCTETHTFQHEEKNDDHVVNCSSSKMVVKEVVACKESNQRLDFWKWGLNGIGIFCSLGMAAATICIIICGNGRRHKQQNQKLKFQIYHDNKRIKQVVQKANEAISAMRVRGVPLVNAQITYGGHYEIIS
ncbi:hypothetical protein L1987_67551 [Smallanthus sonchifolius]|uniref:Uncharacterized protein n=1 Tax=Smallanthus sonchifolius TaxID=185202 RepID=A0ACB9B436_9ASTR|nr:hypothetical protein L1987_67551 [Smallanthus sonchifolius]